MGGRWNVVGVVWLVLVGCGPIEAAGEAFDPDQTTSGSGSSSSSGGDETSSSSSGMTMSTTTMSTTNADSSSGIDGMTTSSGESSGDSSSGEPNDCPRAQVMVAADDTLNVRPDPSTNQEPIGSLANGTIVDVLDDEVIGESVGGNTIWFEISHGDLQGFVSSAFAACTMEEPPMIDENGWYLPLGCGMSATVSQGNFGATSHSGTSAYAFDFAIPLGTPLVAMADGVVTHTFDGTGPGDPCYDGGGPECFEAANYVTLLHADGTKSTYRHLQSVSVAVGETVLIGDTVGLSGSTGYSTGRHAHVMRMEDCGQFHCQSIEVAFNDVAGDGVPNTGETVTSGNCP